MTDIKHYTYRVSYSSEDGEYVGTCVEFPSLSYLSESRVDALQGITLLVKEVVDDMQDNDEHVPVALVDKKYSGKFQLRVPPYLHRQLTILAAEEGVSLNRYVSSKLV